ncbi:ParA family protein, partial [Allomesorhizobium camelthorni]
MSSFKFEKTKLLSCVNLKGGVGKTALAVNFSAYCGKEGKSVLLVDLDPQTNATFSCISVEDWQDHSEKKGTVANLFGTRAQTTAAGSNSKEAADLIIEGVFDGVDLLPSHLDLFTIDLDLGAQFARETIIRRALAPLDGEYDLIVFDCPPNLTIPTQNALACSTHYVVPVSPDFLSSLGIALLQTRVQEFSDALENPIESAGILLSRVGRPSYFRQQTKGTLRAEFGDEVLSTEITERSSVSESAAKRCSVFGMNDQAAKTEFTDAS